MEQRIWHDESQSYMTADEIAYYEQLSSMYGGAAQQQPRAASARTRQRRLGLQRLWDKANSWLDRVDAAYWNWSIRRRTNVGPQTLTVIDWVPGIPGTKAGHFMATRYKPYWQYAHGGGKPLRGHGASLSDAALQRLLRDLHWHPGSRMAWAPAPGHTEVVVFTTAAWPRWPQENPTPAPAASAAFSESSSDDTEIEQRTTTDEFDDADTFSGVEWW